MYPFICLSEYFPLQKNIYPPSSILSFFLFSAVDLTKDAISSLPASRQRNSLLTVGKNLLNIPDEDPTDYHKFSSADLVKPLKKRFLPGFNFDNNAVVNDLKRSASTSLLDLSKACEAERAKINVMCNERLEKKTQK